MRRFTFMVTALIVLTAFISGAQGARKLRVVTTIPDLKSLTEAVGGDFVDVDSLTRGTQNFHEAEVKPSMMLKLRRADAVIQNGVDLDAWIDVAGDRAHQTRLLRGGPRPRDRVRGAQ